MRAYQIIKKKVQIDIVTCQENHSLLHTILCLLRCPISKENAWQVQGLTFFCYVIMHRHVLKLTNYCKKETEINDYYYYYICLLLMEIRDDSLCNFENDHFLR